MEVLHQEDDEEVDEVVSDREKDLRKKSPEQLLVSHLFGLVLGEEVGDQENDYSNDVHTGLRCEEDQKPNDHFSGDVFLRVGFVGELLALELHFLLLEKLQQKHVLFVDLDSLDQLLLYPHAHFFQVVEGRVSHYPDSSDQKESQNRRVQKGVEISGWNQELLDVFKAHQDGRNQQVFHENVFTEKLLDDYFGENEEKEEDVDVFRVELELVQLEDEVEENGHSEGGEEEGLLFLTGHQIHLVFSLFEIVLFFMHEFRVEASPLIRQAFLKLYLLRFQSLSVFVRLVLLQSIDDIYFLLGVQQRYEQLDSLVHMKHSEYEQVDSHSSILDQLGVFRVQEDVVVAVGKVGDLFGYLGDEVEDYTGENEVENTH